ncbi:MAG: pseudouridine synthase [Deltaproteobacteria bacterium]|nr:pseudouridine synthase [Deltaproteobacteria bacterium]
MAVDHLVKILAERGLASRRGSERMIREGRVQVGGKVITEPGQRVDPQQETVLVDGHPLPPVPAPVYLVLHKPKGTITSRDDPQERRTVFDLLPEAPLSLHSVGRLDFNTEGVLLLTNDGDLAYRLTHPSYGVAKSYLVKVSGTPTERQLGMLTRGMRLEDGPTEPALVSVVQSSGPSTWLLITIQEGRNRIIRRMIDHIGHRTLKLKRVGFGGITLRGVEVGGTRALSKGELEHLRRQVIEPGKRPLRVSWEVRKAVAETLRLPPPPPEDRESRVAEDGRPYRNKGWARPQARKGRGPARAGRRAGASRGRKTGGEGGGGGRKGRGGGGRGGGRRG